MNYEFDQNYQDSSENTLLHIAIKYNNITLVSKLITKNPNFYLKNKDGNTGLYECIKASKIEIFRLLINLVEKDKIIDEILDKDSSDALSKLFTIDNSFINFKDKDNSTIFSLALQKNKSSITNTLLDSYGANIEEVLLNDPSITHIGLSNRSIKTSEINELVRKFETDNNVKSLNLSKASMSNDIAIRIFDALKNYREIEYLDIG